MLSTHSHGIDVAKVPRREAGMTPYEVMLSESQERMLVIVEPKHEADVRALFEHWDLHCAAIGVVTDDGVVRIHDGGVEVAAIKATLLTDGPTYVRDVVKPQWLTELQEFDLTTLPDVAHNAHNGSDRSSRVSDTLLELLASPEIASKRLVWRQYDHQVGTNTVVGPGSDAAVIRIKGTKKALAISTDGNAAYTYLDPYAGVYRSTDGGANFVKVFSGEIAGGSSFNAKMYSVPGQAKHLFFTSGTQDGPSPADTKLMRSIDGGQTWSAVKNVLEAYALGFGKSRTGVGYPAIYLAGYVDGSFGIWRSDDNAANWVNLGSNPLNIADEIKAVSGDINSFGKVYVGFGGSGAAYGTIS